MLFNRRVPDEGGWYWRKSNDQMWQMAYVDDHDEQVTLFHHDQNGVLRRPATVDFDKITEESDWYGPIGCPGGDVPATTVLLSEDLVGEAKRDGKAIVVRYFDFRFCRNRGTSAHVTVYDVMSRGEAQDEIQSLLNPWPAKQVDGQPITKAE